MGDVWILGDGGGTAGLLDNVGADYLWARAVLLVGPTIASAGMTIQVRELSPNRAPTPRHTTALYITPSPNGPSAAIPNLHSALGTIRTAGGGKRHPNLSLGVTRSPPLVRVRDS